MDLVQGDAKATKTIKYNARYDFQLKCTCQRLCLNTLNFIILQLKTHEITKDPFWWLDMLCRSQMELL